MIASNSSKKEPLVGFFNLFYNLGETCQSVLIAKQYEKLGGKLIFFSHGGDYEKYATSAGFKVLQVNPIFSEEYVDLLWKSSRLETHKNPFSKEILLEQVKNEVKAFKQAEVDLIVSNNWFPCCISARVADVPLVAVTPRVVPNFTIFPEDGEFFFTHVFPESIKLRILNWYIPRSKMYVRSFIKVAKIYGITPPKVTNDITTGDYTIYIDFPEFLGIDKEEIPPNEFYVGHNPLDKLLAKNMDKEQYEKEEQELRDHIRKGERSILVTLGSSGTKEFFKAVLQSLNKTDYRVIAVYTSILKKDELPEVGKHILLKKFIPSPAEVNKWVDLAIIHGGNSTVYNAAYAGKPVIGIPMQFEQHGNIDLLVQHGMARMGSRKYFKEKVFLELITEIFENYDKYLLRAQQISRMLPKPEGDQKAAEVLMKIVKQKV